MFQLIKTKSQSRKQTETNRGNSSPVGYLEELLALLPKVAFTSPPPIDWHIIVIRESSMKINLRTGYDPSQHPSHVNQFLLKLADSAIESHQLPSFYQLAQEISYWQLRFSLGLIHHQVEPVRIVGGAALREVWSIGSHGSRTALIVHQRASLEELHHRWRQKSYSSRKKMNFLIRVSSAVHPSLFR